MGRRTRRSEPGSASRLNDDWSIGQLSDGSILSMTEDEARLAVRRRNAEELSFEIGDKLIILLKTEPEEYQVKLVTRFEEALEDSGILIGMADMKPLEYCQQLFCHFPAYLSPILERWMQFGVELKQESAESLVDQLIALLPSRGRGE